MGTLREVDNALTSGVVLRDVVESDLPIFFEQQRDPNANHMAAFTSRNPADEGAFKAHWTKMLGDDSVTIKAIVCDGNVAGNIAKYQREGKPEVTYWIGRQYWGKGVATEALSQFLRVIKLRPLYAGAAKDNVASLRVLQKCGFAICGATKGFAKARDEEIEELLLILE